MQKKSLISNSFFNIMRTFVTLVFPLIIFMYASRILGPAGVGKVEFGKNLSGYFVLLASLGINNYGIREGARLRDNKNEFSVFVHEILTINIISTFFSMFLFLIFSFVLPVLVPYRTILLVFSLTIVMTPMGIEWVYGALEEYKYIALRTLFFQALALVVLFIFVKTSDDIVWYAIVLIVSSVGSNIINLVHSRKFVDYKRQGSYDVKRHLKPIFVLFALAISNSLYSYVDTTMLGFIRGDTEVGLYTAALKVNRIVVNVLGAVGAAMMPRLSYLWANGEKKEFEKITHTVVDILLMISVPCCIGIIGLSKPILIAFCGKEYVDASLAMILLSLIIIVLSLSTFFNMHILVPINKEVCTLKAIISGLVANMSINAFLIPSMGRDGAAIGTIIGESVVLIIGYYYANKEIYFTIKWKSLLQFMVASIPIYGICILFQYVFEHNLLQIVFSIVGSAFIYIIILVLLKNEAVIRVRELITNFIARRLK